MLAGLAVAAAVGCGGDKAPRFDAPMRLGGVEVPAETLNKGAAVYMNHCASCHGADGSGNGAAARKLDNPPRDFRAAEFKYKADPDAPLPTDEDLESVLVTGKIDNGMPAWKFMTKEDRHAVIQFIKTFSPRWTEGGGGPPEAAS